MLLEATPEFVEGPTILTPTDPPVAVHTYWDADEGVTVDITGPTQPLPVAYVDQIIEALRAAAAWRPG